jgi:hypothetical protein
VCRHGSFPYARQVNGGSATPTVRPYNSSLTSTASNVVELTVESVPWSITAVPLLVSTCTPPISFLLCTQKTFPGRGDCVVELAPTRSDYPTHQLGGISGAADWSTKTSMADGVEQGASFQSGLSKAGRNNIQVTESEGRASQNVLTRRRPGGAAGLWPTFFV